MPTEIKSKFTSPADMMAWQYREIIFELGEVARHAGDPNCPCIIAGKGEYCVPKHLLSVHGLCRETAAMEENRRYIEMLEQLQEEAFKKHIALKDRIVCDKAHGDEGDIIDWARQWRKKLESIYYHDSCRLKLKQEATMYEDDPLLNTIHAELCPGIIPCLAKGKPKLPVCNAEESKRLEDCILDIKDRNREAGCKPEGTGSKRCPNPFAVCRASIGCRFGPGKKGTAPVGVH